MGCAKKSFNIVYKMMHGNLHEINSLIAAESTAAEMNTANKNGQLNTILFYLWLNSL